MDTFILVLLFGISYGLILFLLATGLSMTMGLMRIVNMAHGALYMVGAYAGLAAANYTHNFLIGLLAGTLCAGLVGLLLEVAFLRRLFKQEQSQVLLTIGFIYILTNIVQWIWGAFPFGGIIPDIFAGSINIGTVTFPVFRFAIIGFGLVMALLLWLFQEKTKIGAMVRAGMDNREIAGALGINLKVIFTGIFTLGSLLAGLCGLIGAPLTGVHLASGWETLLLSLIVVVVGGTGSIQGALLGGLLIGLVNMFGTAYFPDFAYFIVYVVLILILLIKPSGLLGREMPHQAGSDNLEKTALKKKKSGIRPGHSGHRTCESPRSNLFHLIPYITVFLLLLILPPFLSSYYQSMLIKILIFSIFAMSLDLIMGYLGMPSFGHAAYLGFAGYVIGILIVRFNINLFWVVVPTALIATVILSAVIGYISLRVSGVYFLLVTMAFGQLLSVVATKWIDMTGGTDGLVGIPMPDLGITGFTWSDTGFYYFVFFVFALSFFILNRIVRSSFGKALVGIRGNEDRMRSLGFNAWKLKYLSIIIGGFFAGVAGILFAYFYGTMVPSYLALETSALPMLMVIIGGPSTLWGSCLGAAVIILVQQMAAVYIPDRWPLILGCIFVLCVMLMRGGFANYLSGFWRRFEMSHVLSKNIKTITTKG